MNVMWPPTGAMPSATRASTVGGGSAVSSTSRSSLRTLPPHRNIPAPDGSFHLNLARSPTNRSATLGEECSRSDADGMFGLFSRMGTDACRTLNQTATGSRGR
jgi:hypothetical protein